MHILRLYQVQALSHCLTTPHPALFMDMRLGKNVVTIRSIKLTNHRLILAVAPYSALRSWQQELTNEGEELVYLLTGTAEARRMRLQNVRLALGDGRRVWCLINKEGHRVIGPELGRMGFDVVVLDESTFIKHYKAEVTQYFLRWFRDAKLRMILTGTPAPESELEYFCQMAFLDPGILGFKNYWTFRKAWFTKPKDAPGEHQWFMTIHGKKELVKRLQKHCFFLKRKDVNMGQDKIYESRYVKMPKDVREVYNTAEEEFLLEIKGKVLDKTVFATQKYIWLRRICGGVFHKLWNGKVDVLIELLQGELRHEKVIVWAVFLEELDHIYAQLNTVGISTEVICGAISHKKRDERRDAFQCGNTQVLACQPEVYRHGADLAAGDTEIYYSSPNGLETREQTEDRFIEASGTGSKLIIDIHAEDTVDESNLRSLRKKENRSAAVRTMIKDMNARYDRGSRT